MANRTIRCRAIIDRCRTEASSAAELAAELRVARRSIDGDLAWLRRAFPGRLRGERGIDGHKRLIWTGGAPRLLSTALNWLSEEELLALIAARGLLRDPRGGNAEGHAGDYPGLLDGALHGLLQRLELIEEAAEIAPEAVQVSRFAARAEDPATLDECWRALIGGCALRCSYTNNRGERHRVHCRPVRLLNFSGEWHLIAWAPHDGDPDGGRLKQYRVSRIEVAGRERDDPPRCPPYIPQHLVDDRISEAFRATGSEDPQDRRRIVLAASPDALPHLEGRCWGGDPHWDGPGPKLPEGWRRLSFFSTGLQELRHWVLGFGTAMRAEEPEELVAWLRQEAAGLLKAMSKTPKSARKPACESGA